jgi:RNA polymerase sigma-70 factor (ECF subfamily)
MTKGGNDIDIGKLFEQYYPGLLFYATRFVSEAEAKDVVQDAFFDLWNRKDSLELGDKIQAYLYKFVYTRSLNIISHKKIQNKYSEAVQELYTMKLEFYNSSAANEIALKIENDELREAIESAIEQLPGKCREVFKLSYLYEMKNKDIAGVLDISHRTVEAHMYKALKVLRVTLKHLFSFVPGIINFLWY